MPNVVILTVDVARDFSGKILASSNPSMLGLTNLILVSLLA